MVDVATTRRFSSSLTLFLGISKRGADHTSETFSSWMKPRRSVPGALLDQVEREALHRGVVLVLQDLEAVDDRPHRIDDVVADPRAQQGREIEGFELKSGHHWSIPKTVEGRGLLKPRP